MKLTNSNGRVKGSRSSMDNDQAEKSKSTRDKTKKIAATTAEDGNNNGNKNNDKNHRSKAKGWRKALNDGGDTTEDAESSALSDLSDSTEDGYDDDGAAKSIAGERSEDYELFEKALRSKHSKACKAMSVRHCNVAMFFVLFMKSNLLTQFVSFAPVEWCLPQSISRL